MKFKSYAGKDLAEIVPRIRDELGPDAVILKQRQTQSGGVGGFFSRRGVEVLAADRAPADVVAAPDGGAVAAPPAPAPQPQAQGASDSGPSAAALLAETFAEALNEHVARTGGDAAPAPAPQEEDAMPAARMLRERREETSAYVPPPAPPTRGANAIRLEAVPQPERGLHIAPLPVFARGDELDEEGSDLLLELERAGVSGEIARRLVDEVVLHVQPFSARPLRELARDRIAARIRTEQGWTPDGSPRRIAIVGPTGVGKTAAVVRLAAAWAEAGLSVGLVSVAPELSEEPHPLTARLGAIAGSEADRLLAYVGGNDLARVASPMDAARALQRFGDRDVMLIDTPGVGIASDARLEAIGCSLIGLEPHEVHAALPLALAGREADAAIGVLSRLGANRVLVTKTDEARFAGGLLDLASRSALPLSYMTCGLGIPGDMAPADGGSIARRILPI